MSIIQQIREKAAWLVFGLIALSLLGFLAMDAFVGRSRLFGNKSTVVGAIDGDKIEYTKYQSEVNALEDQDKARGLTESEDRQQNIRDNVWRQEVEDDLLSENYKKLGLQVSDKEMNDMLVGEDAIPEIKKAFTDPHTGVFDAQTAAARLNQMRTIYKSGKKNDREYEGARQFFEEGEPQIEKSRLREKYLSLLANSYYVPKWMIEKMNADNSQLAAISYVNTPYTTVADSTVKVGDDEIDDYVSQHKTQFKQEETRSITYVTFNDAPSSADSAKIRQSLLDLKPEFASTGNVDAFLARVGTETAFYDEYLEKSKIPVPYKDSILALPKGGLFGPYQDAGDFVIAKMIDEKSFPDSVKARHILVATVDPQSHQPIMDDTTAKKKIDSIKNLIDQGANFDSVAAHLSDDKGSAVKGGDLGWFTRGSMVKNFNDYVFFEGKKGDKKIVKTEFGYHFIEIMDQKAFQPNYKIAYLSRKIETSPETDQAASGLANIFAGDSRNSQDFDNNAEKQHLSKLLATDIEPTAFVIPGLGANRQFVQWINGASLGEVSEPFTVGDKYVVAILTGIYHKGLMSAQKARPMVEPILRNRKKADLIIKKLNNPATLQAASTASAQPINKADSLQFASPFIPNVGQESKVIGSAFNKQLVGKPASPPIPGNGGVFVIRVENVYAKPNPNADVAGQRQMMEQQARQMISYQAVESLRRIADIEDNRSKFF